MLAVVPLPHGQITTLSGEATWSRGLSPHRIPLGARLGRALVAAHQAASSLRVQQLLRRLRVAARAPTPTPHPSLAKVMGVSSRVAPFLLSTLLPMPWQASRVPNGGRQQNAGGGVLLHAPSPLRGSPIFLQGSLRLTWSPMRDHPMEEAWVPRMATGHLTGSTG
jgi:hypothetical protein